MASPGLSLLHSVFFGKPFWMLPKLATMLGVEGAEMLRHRLCSLGLFEAGAQNGETGPVSGVSLPGL